jgi:hypothetical protein
MNARAHGVLAREASIFLKTQEFLYGRREFRLPMATNDPRMLLAQIEPLFKELFRARVPYRATGVSLHGFVTHDTQTHDLFGETRRAQGEMRVFSALDSLNKRFGRGTVVLAASMQAGIHRDPDRRRKNAKRPGVAMPAQYAKKSMNMPYLGNVF